MRQQLTEFRQAHQGNLGQQSQKLLKRLADSSVAIEALARLENRCQRASCWQNILMACINAERLTRTFQKQIKEANETLVRVERLRKASAALRRFLSDNKNKNWAVLCGNGAAIERGLDLLDNGIGTEKGVAEEAFAQFGATRKTKIESAPRSAAIWALSEAVKLHTGKLHYPEVASLASVICATTIDENIVKHAVRNRKQSFDAMEKKRAQRLLDMQNFRAHSDKN
jgi:hypothetical protein